MDQAACDVLQKITLRKNGKFGTTLHQSSHPALILKYQKALNILQVPSSSLKPGDRVMKKKDTVLTLMQFPINLMYLHQYSLCDFFSQNTARCKGNSSISYFPPCLLYMHQSFRARELEQVPCTMFYPAIFEECQQGSGRDLNLKIRQEEMYNSTVELILIFLNVFLH